MLDSRPRGCGFEPHRRHCSVVSLSKNINPNLVLVQPRKTRPFIMERLLMGRKNQIKQNSLPFLLHPVQVVELLWVVDKLQQTSPQMRCLSLHQIYQHTYVYCSWRKNLLMLTCGLAFSRCLEIFCFETRPKRNKIKIQSTFACPNFQNSQL